MRAYILLFAIIACQALIRCSAEESDVTANIDSDGGVSLAISRSTCTCNLVYSCNLVTGLARGIYNSTYSNGTACVTVCPAEVSKNCTCTNLRCHLADTTHPYDCSCTTACHRKLVSYTCAAPIELNGQSRGLANYVWETSTNVTCKHGPSAYMTLGPLCNCCNVTKCGIDTTVPVISTGNWTAGHGCPCAVSRTCTCSPNTAPIGNTLVNGTAVTGEVCSPSGCRPCPIAVATIPNGCHCNGTSCHTTDNAVTCSLGRPVCGNPTLEYVCDATTNRATGGYVCHWNTDNSVCSCPYSVIAQLQRVFIPVKTCDCCNHATNGTCSFANSTTKCTCSNLSATQACCTQGANTYTCNVLNGYTIASPTWTNYNGKQCYGQWNGASSAYRCTCQNTTCSTVGSKVNCTCSEPCLKTVDSYTCETTTQLATPSYEYETPRGRSCKYGTDLSSPIYPLPCKCCGNSRFCNITSAPCECHGPISANCPCTSEVTTCTACDSTGVATLSTVNYPPGCINPLPINVSKTCTCTPRGICSTTPIPATEGKPSIPGISCRRDID